MDLEIIILSKVIQTEKGKYYIPLNMCNLKSSADEFIYKTETDTQKYEISKVGNEDAGGG